VQLDHLGAIYEEEKSSIWGRGVEIGNGIVGEGAIKSRGEARRRRRK